MAFLRSIARCKQSYAVSRKFSTSIRSGGHRPSHHRHALPLLNHIQFTRAELLACQKYYLDLRRELNTVDNNESSTSINEHQRRSAAMSTLAATKPAAASSATTTTSVQNSKDPKPQRDPLDVSFNDPIAAFKSKTTWELIRAYFVYLMCSSEYLVENNMKVKETTTNEYMIFEWKRTTTKTNYLITLWNNLSKLLLLLYWYRRTRNLRINQRLKLHSKSRQKEQNLRKDVGKRGDKLSPQCYLVMRKYMTHSKTIILVIMNRASREMVM